MAIENNYKTILAKLMSFLDDKDYDIDDEFSQERLQEITPRDLMAFLNFITFGEEEPGEGRFLEARVMSGELEVQRRSSSIEYYKKAISGFFPNRLMAWNELASVGNPTRSREINDLIKLLKKLEVRGKGAPTHACRAITDSEFRKIHEIMKSDESSRIKYGFSAALNFQFHFIARIDDTTQQFSANIQPHNQFDFLLKAKLNWSKNVTEEREAPFQSMIPSMDHEYCVHLSLGLWLEIYGNENPTAELSPYTFHFSNDVSIPEGGKKSKQSYQKFLHENVFQNEYFQGTTGNLGSHSTRKYASTECRKRGCSKEEKELRGRWKAHSRISDRYDDVELPFPDAKVATTLCIGGPMKYMADRNVISDNFILTYVSPCISRRFGRQVALVLGKAILWCVFAPEGDGELPGWLYDRIKVAYEALPNKLPDGTNPVNRVPIVITGHDGEVHCDEIVDVEAGGEAGVNGAAGLVQGDAARRVQGAFVDRPLRDQLLAVHSQLMTQRQSQQSLRNMLEQLRIENQRQYQVLLSNLRRIVANPTRRRAPAVDPGGGAPAVDHEEPAHPHREPPATLSPTPRNLFILWEEYVTGIGGRKPAYLFTPQERGANKHKYTRRKVVWDVVKRLTRQGFHARVAIDRIYEAYGRDSTVTTIINRMRVDRRSNTWPAPLR